MPRTGYVLGRFNPSTTAALPCHRHHQLLVSVLRDWSEEGGHGEGEEAPASLRSSACMVEEN
uniref:Uncharacterized protein n=1 Tax=Oryza brachyantha TaxID=4533 RepID=J3LGI5_ORYBR